MNIMDDVRGSMQGFLHCLDQYGQEVAVMMWILLAALVGVVTLSVKEQLKRERDAYCVSTLAREYSL